MDDLLVRVVLPLTLAFIMFTLGLGLRLADFVRVAQQPRAFLTGLVNQMVFLPLVAFGLAVTFGMPPILAVGMMILGLSPGGVTTNVLAKLAGGNVALSISLTAVVTVLSVVTVPLLVALSVSWFLGGDVGEVDTAALTLAMVLITLIPVALGMGIRAILPGVSARLSGPLTGVAVALFAVIILAAIATNIGVVMANLAALGPAVVILMLAMLSLGIVSARVMGLPPRDGSTISVESGVQNGTLGVAVAAIVAAQLGEGDTAGFTDLAVPSALYGALMYLLVLPFVWWRRRVAAR